LVNVLRMNCLAGNMILKYASKCCFFSGTRKNIFTLQTRIEKEVYEEIGLYSKKAMQENFIKLIPQNLQSVT
jgi:hypothetical protein